MTKPESKMKIVKTLIQRIIVIFFTFVVSAALVPQASAHLMVAQHGTLNVKDNGVYMVLSLPVSAFENIDDDGDGKMSSNEFIKHKPSIVATVNNKVKLSDKEGSRPLQGLLITPVAPHETANAPSEQLVIMGRFSLDKSNTENDHGLTFHIQMFGKNTIEKTIIISASRKSKSSVNAEKEKFKLTPQQSKRKLFKPVSL